MTASVKQPNSRCRRFKIGMNPQRNLLFDFFGYSLFGFFLLSCSNALSPEAPLFEVASALGTVGLSTGITDALSITGKATLICLMFIGRLGVLTFGIAIWSKTTNNKEEVSVMDDLAV